MRRRQAGERVIDLGCTKEVVRPALEPGFARHAAHMNERIAKNLDVEMRRLP